MAELFGMRFIANPLLPANVLGVAHGDGSLTLFVRKDGGVHQIELPKPSYYTVASPFDGGDRAKA